MQEQFSLAPRTYSPPTRLTIRSLLIILRRRRGVMIFVFLAVFAGVMLSALLSSPRYEAQMKVVIERERADPVVSASTDRDVAAPAARLTDQDVNSEVDLLKSRDLLQRVVLDCKLHEKKLSWWRRYFPAPTEQQRIAAAVDRLQQGLVIDPPNRSNMVTITYGSANPEMSAAVLKSLGNRYLEKHLQVHGRAGMYEFYATQTEHYSRELSQLQARLRELNKEKGTVSADSEKGFVLQKAGEFQANLAAEQAAIAAIERRIAALEDQRNATPPRVTTQVRTSATLLENLKSALFAQESKRSELLAKYAPTYRAVRDIEAQIADTRAAIERAEKAPTTEQITAENPTYAWIASELTKARSELAGARARAESIRRNVAGYRDQAQMLSVTAVEQSNILRAMKLADDSFATASRKKEEARVAEALDRNQIMNVAIAEHPIVPALPTSSPVADIALGLAMALIVSLGAAIVTDHLDASFHEPEDVERYLNIPVLASIPRHAKLLPGVAASTPGGNGMGGNAVGGTIFGDISSRGETNV